jgi:hypothetical protein
MGKAPKPPRPGPFECLDADLMTLKGTKGRPVPERVRRLGIDLVLAAGRNRVAHLKPGLIGGLTENQLAGALARLTAWPEGNPLVTGVEDGRVTLRPLPDDRVRAYRWLHDSSLPWSVKRSVWLIRASKFEGRDERGRERFRFNLTGRRWPAIVDCVPQRSRGSRGRAEQLRKAAVIREVLLKLGIVADIEARPGRGQGPAICTLADHEPPARWLRMREAAAPESRQGRGVTPAAGAAGSGVTAGRGVTPRGSGASHHAEGGRHTTGRGGVTPRNSTDPLPTPLPTPSPHPRAGDATAHTALPLAGRCAAGGGGLRPGAGEVMGGQVGSQEPPSRDGPSHPAANPPPGPELGPARHPAAPARTAASGAPGAAPGGPGPREPGRPAERNGQPGEAIVRHGSGAPKGEPLRRHRPGPAPPAGARRHTDPEKNAIRAAVEAVQHDGYGDDLCWHRLQETEMGLEKVVAHVYSRRGELAEGWTREDLAAAFRSSDLDGLRRKSWGLIIGEKFWPRYVAAVNRLVERRRQHERERRERNERAAAAATGPDPLLRARADAYFLGEGQPGVGLPLLLEALEHPEAGAEAARALRGWALARNWGNTARSPWSGWSTSSASTTAGTRTLISRSDGLSISFARPRPRPRTKAMNSRGQPRKPMKTTPTWPPFSRRSEKKRNQARARHQDPSWPYFEAAGAGGPQAASVVPAGRRPRVREAREADDLPGDHRARARWATTFTRTIAPTVDRATRSAGPASLSPKRARPPGRRPHRPPPAESPPCANSSTRPIPPGRAPVRPRPRLPALGRALPRPGPLWRQAPAPRAVRPRGVPPRPGRVAPRAPLEPDHPGGRRAAHRAATLSGGRRAHEDRARTMPEDDCSIGNRTKRKQPF